MSTYNLNDNVNDSFEFELAGHRYTMRYPTVEETEKIQGAVKEADKDDNPMATLDSVYDLIEGQGDAPSIKKLLPKQNIRVLKNFTEMIKVEFGGE